MSDGMIVAASRTRLRQQLVGLVGRVDLVVTAMRRRADARRFADRLRLCRTLLVRDAFVIVAVPTTHEPGTRSLLDLPALVAEHCAVAGFVLVARCLAYAPVDAGGPRTRIRLVEASHQTILVMQVADAVDGDVLARMPTHFPRFDVGLKHVDDLARAAA
ncbi:hypothetical protein [Kutzneria buriramensis]|uniref:hypothetical protein n=1 Tax=Kutzneria buriramensis TaxID=1045776 RepID=UPI001FE4FD5A|nr:hypothetical protein [Kutzneria buriramensis]